MELDLLKLKDLENKEKALRKDVVNLEKSLRAKETIAQTYLNLAQEAVNDPSVEQFLILALLINQKQEKERRKLS